jgi:hypothetical protein
MVVDVLSRLQLADELASAVSATNESGEREVVPDAVLSGFNALVDEGLDSVPGLATNKRFMPAWIGHSVPVEITGIDPLAQDLDTAPSPIRQTPGTSFFLPMQPLLSLLACQTKWQWRLAFV